MAFSGDKTWGVTRNDIILAALRKIGEYDSADLPSNAEVNDAALSLNAIVKEWTLEGIGIFIRQRTVLFLSQDQQTYNLGGVPSEDGTNFRWHKACIDSDLRICEAAIDLFVGATVLTLDDGAWKYIDGATASKPSSSAKPIGIRLDDGTIYWSSVSATGTNTITILNGIPGNASAGRRVYVFTNYTTRPIRLLAAYRTDTNFIDTQMEIISRTDYERQTNKGSTGDPTQVAFAPQMVQQAVTSVVTTLFSQVKVWPSVNSMTCDYINLITEHYADDLDLATDNPQFPAEWANALIWNLAAEMSFEYGLPAKDRQQLLMMAGSKKSNLIDSADIENASVSLEPDYGR